MDYQKDENYGKETTKKRNVASNILYWIIPTFFILIVIIVVFRSISTSIENRTPKELQNYLIVSPEINETYINLKDDFKIYQIDIQNPYIADNDDSLVIESVYYLEDVKNLQIMIKCKNSAVQPLILNSESPFIAFLEISTKSDDDDWFGSEPYEMSTLGFSVSNEEIFGNNADKYQYLIYSFNDVEIDYINSLVTLNIFLNNKERNKQNYGAIITNEDNKLGQFAIYTVIGYEERPADMPKYIIMTQKSIVPAKNFKFQ